MGAGEVAGFDFGFDEEGEGPLAPGVVGVAVLLVLRNSDPRPTPPLSGEDAPGVCCGTELSVGVC